MRILAINPGSTATKVGVFEDDAVVRELIADAHDLRGALARAGYADTTWNAVAARGGLLRPLQSGTYRVNQRMLDDLETAARGRHASNAGARLAHEIACASNCIAVIVDPVSVDEMADDARLSGLNGIERECLSHALNTKAIAKRHARTTGVKYEDSNYIVAHLGSGISVSAHTRGRMIDVNNSREEGPFSTERSGSVPTLTLVQRAIREQWTDADAERILFREGGIYSYLGTKDIRSVNVDHRVITSMTYQVSKEIGAMAAALRGRVDAVLVTGGMAHSEELVQQIADRVNFIAPLFVYPGEDELRALAEGAARVLKGEEPLLEY